MNDPLVRCRVHFSVLLLSTDTLGCDHMCGAVSVVQNTTLDFTVLCKNKNQLLIQAMFQSYPNPNFLFLILNQNAADR